MKEVIYVELAKVTTKGQITIPKSIRELLKLKNGSKVLFVQKNNEVIIQNSSMVALKKIQNSFDGEADRLELANDDDVVNFIKEVRKERKK